MEALFSGVQQFLNSVGLVSELEASDVALVAVEQAFRAQLTLAEHEGSANLRARTMQKLTFVRELRALIARQLSDIRAREELQILGQ